MQRQEWDTKHWIVDNHVDKTVENLSSYPQIVSAAQWILKGEVVAFPTETVYGLGANALSDKATMKIFEAKGRPSDNPLIVHIATMEQLAGIVDNIPKAGRKLMEAFWPGPLTIVLPKGPQVCTTVTAGLETVAVRMPAHPIALAIISACGKPLAAPSANRSGKPSPTSAVHVLKDLRGRVAGVIDGGKTGVGLESTVIDVTGSTPTILRPGGITKEQLEEVLGKVEIDPALIFQQKHEVEGEVDIVQELKPKSPGVKYQHYAPEGDMWMISIEHGIDEMRRKIQELARTAQIEGDKVGILTTDEGMKYYQADVVLSVGSRVDLSTVARQIYHVLRCFDHRGVQRIYAESFPLEGIGEAIMNRLYKAAGGQVIS